MTHSRPPGPDYSDPLFGVTDRLPVVTPAPGALTEPEYGEFSRRTYGRADRDAYPEQPAPDAVWPLVSGNPPRPRRRMLGGVLIVASLLVMVAGVATTWLLVGGGSRGTTTPEQAVDGFLSAIFEAHDPGAAARHTCERARDDAELERIVFRVKQNEEAYTAARTTWTYPPIRRAGREASADVTLTMTTVNEQVSSRTITVRLVDDRGWWVCDVDAR